MTVVERRLTRWIVFGAPFVVFATGFAHLYATYLLVRWFAPDLLGPAAARPAAVAASVTLVALPMHLALAWALSRDGVRAAWAGTEPPAPPPRGRWRRSGAYLAVQVPDVVAAWIVLEARSVFSMTLFTVTVAGPIVLYWSLRGSWAGVRRRWRRRHTGTG